MPVIQVRFVWRPRHTPSGAAIPVKHQACYEYGGTLGYDACLQFKVALDEEDKQAAYEAEFGSMRSWYIFWLKQELTITGTYMDASGATCFLNPMHFVELFSVNSVGATPQDFHSNFSLIYGNPCDLPCQEHAKATGKLELLRTDAVSGGEAMEAWRDEMGNPEGTAWPPEYGRLETDKGPGELNTSPQGGAYSNGYWVRGGAVAWEKIISKVDPFGTAAARKKYGSASYGYEIKIEHCSAAELTAAVAVTTGPGPVGVGLDGRPKVFPGGRTYVGPAPKAAPPKPPSAEVPGSSWQEPESDKGKGGRRPIGDSFTLLGFAPGGGRLVAGTSAAVLGAFWRRSRRTREGTTSELQKFLESGAATDEAGTEGDGQSLA